MGLMFRVIRKYREEVDTPNYNLDPKNPFIRTDNFLNVYFDRYKKQLQMLISVWGIHIAYYKPVMLPRARKTFNVFHNDR